MEHLDSKISEYVALVNTLGETVLVETLRMAAYYVYHSSGISYYKHGVMIQLNEARKCYAFVQGTGLQTIINHFGLLYDSERLKETFNYCLKKSA